MCDYVCVCVHVTQNLVLGCPDSFQLPPCFARPWRLSELGPAHHARAVLAGRLGPDHQQEVLRGGRFSALGGVGDMFQHVSTSGGEKNTGFPDVSLGCMFLFGNAHGVVSERCCATAVMIV